MADTGENFAAFNSRALVEMVGGVTDEALKATKIKQFLSVLAGRFFNWAGRKSLFTLHLGIKCCAIEMAAAATPRFDGDRFGVLFRSSPRQSDVLLVNGPISKKFADKIVRLWEQMPEPLSLTGESGSHSSDELLNSISICHHLAVAPYLCL